jgi:hypothetical protein
VSHGLADGVRKLLDIDAPPDVGSGLGEKGATAASGEMVVGGAL